MMYLKTYHTELSAESKRGTGQQDFTFTVLTANYNSDSVAAQYMEKNWGTNDKFHGPDSIKTLEPETVLIGAPYRIAKLVTRGRPSKKIR